jgi:hypothetical protein
MSEITPTLPMARRSCGPDYQCQYPWPADCFVQCGGEADFEYKGEMKHSDGFFEAFPRSPDTFIRGDGYTIKGAEDRAWKKYQRILNCPKHEWERRDRVDEHGYCMHCKMFASNVFEPVNTCTGCGIPTAYGQDKDHQFFCKTCYEALPDEQLNEFSLQTRRFLRRELEEHNMEKVTAEDIGAVLEGMLDALSKEE